MSKFKKINSKNNDVPFTYPSAPVIKMYRQIDGITYKEYEIKPGTKLGRIKQVGKKEFQYMEHIVSKVVCTDTKDPGTVEIVLDSGERFFASKIFQVTMHNKEKIENDEADQLDATLSEFPFIWSEELSEVAKKNCNYRNEVGKYFKEVKVFN